MSRALQFVVDPRAGKPVPNTGASELAGHAAGSIWEVSKVHAPAREPNDLERFFIERANAGDVEGLLALYEPSAIVANGNGEAAIGLDHIREFLVGFLSDRPRLDPSIQAPALCSGDLALTSSRLSDGHITAEVARRQPDGSWLWVVDQFALGNEV